MVTKRGDWKRALYMPTEHRIHISVSESELQEVFAWHDKSKSSSLAFADECVRILVEQYGAKADWIDRSIFFYSHMGQCVENVISGKPIDDPATSVAKHVAIYREECLGLAEPGERLEVTKRNNREIGVGNG